MNFKSVILARGGSKGIPKKNLIKLNGKPLIFYSINASLKSNKIQETWVSSDSDEILSYSKSLGSYILKRPNGISKDDSKSEEALDHFSKNTDFDHMVFIQPTSPFISNIYLDEAIYTYLNGSYDSLVCVSEIHHNLWSGNKPLYDLNQRNMRQFKKEINYIETGMFYITSKKCFDNSKSRISGKIGFYKIPYHHSFEIDDHNDLKFIEKIF